MSLLGAAPAFADCQPPAPSSGQTVNCTGNAPTGFQAGPGVNNLNVNVAPGATVHDNGAFSIQINNGNTVVNNGTVTGGAGVIGIGAVDGNTITNAGSIGVGVNGVAIGLFGNFDTVTSSGTITGGDFSTGIGGNDNNAIIQSGTMTLGDVATGISVGNNNAVTNTGTMTVGATGIAIQAVDSNSIVNSGAIKVGVGGTGIIVFGSNNTVINSGTMDVGDGGVGLISVGPPGSHNVLTNNGTITLASSTCCSSTTGIFAGAGGIVTNNKTITGGDNTIAISTFGSGNTVVNNGNIAVGASTFGPGLSAGIDVSGIGNNTVTNNGHITVGALGIGIATGDSNVITNNGSVVVGANGFSVGNCGCFPSTNNTVVNNGTLDGMIALTGSGNTLTNNGLITITDAGTAVGTTHAIDGDFAQTSLGRLALRVTNTGASDALGVNGTATLGGRLLAIVQPGLYNTTTSYFGVVTSTNLIGTQFAQVTASLAFFNATATYHPTSVDLTLTRLGFGSVPGETQNQRAVGNALDRVYSTSLTGNAATFFINLLGVSSVAVLDQLSGEGTSATQNAAFSASNLFLGTLNDQLWLWRNGERVGITDPDAPFGYAAQARMHPAFKAIPVAAPAFVPSWHVWAAGVGGAQSFDGDAVVGSARARNNTGGGALGADYAVNPDLLLGVGTGGSASSFAVPDRATSGTVDGGHIGFYGMQRWGAAYATAMVSYSRFENTTTRTIAGVGPTEFARGLFASDQLGARFEIGRTWAYGKVGVTPFAAIQVSELWQRGYSEASFMAGGGPGILGLTYAPIAVTSLPIFLGAQLDTRVVFDNGVAWSPFARAAWVHEFEPTRQITASFLAVPGASFAVDGARAASDSVKLDVGSRVAFNRRTALTATLTGEFSDRTQSYAGRLGLRTEF